MSRKLPFNRAIRLLLFTNALVLTASYMLGPIYAFFVEDIGGDILDASLAFATLAISAGFVTLISGNYADRVKENELIIVLGYVIMGLGFAGYIFVSDIWGLLLVQVILGVGGAIYSPPFDAVYSKHLTDTTAGRKWAAWEFTNYVTQAFGALAGGAIVTIFSFDVMFGAMALLCFASALIIWMHPRRVL